MATIPARMTYNDNGSVSVLWGPMGNADTGAVVDLSAFSDISIQFFGTFGGATATLFGSNISTAAQFSALNSYPAGTAISTTSTAIYRVNEKARYYEPRTSGGTGTAITVGIIAK